MTGRKWVARRLALGVATLFIITLIIFVATQALPSDPAVAILGRDATPARLAVLREQLGLNRPLGAQYLSWLGRLLQGDPGMSLAARMPVTELIGSRIGNSLVLILVTAAIVFPTSILLGAWTAIRRDRAFDRGMLMLSFALTALPEFVVGMVLIILFSTTVLKLLPAVVLVPAGAGVLAAPLALVLPVATLSLATIPYLYRLVRATMIDVLETDYITIARLKGMPERIVVFRHALPNALVPVVQACGLVLIYLLGGVVVVEFLFRFPGLGSALTDAVAKRDMPVIQSLVLIFAAAVVLINLIADLLTLYLTPRLRTQSP